MKSSYLPAALRTLHARLATVLLLLLLAVGAFALLATQITARGHRQEASQAMNRDLAATIAESEHGALIDAEGDIDRDELAKIFHWMMVINPDVQFYLLDAEGRVLAYDTMPGPITSDVVDLEPIRHLLAPSPALPILGDDPRDPTRRKIFSVAPLESESGREGYLYIVLDNRPFESMLEGLRGSYILQQGMLSIALSLLLAVLFGFFFFKELTEPLRRLGARMRSFREGRPSAIEAAATPGDELVELERAFGAMVERLREREAENERLEELRGELIENVSHDLRTPIAMIQGYLETLREKALDPDEREAYLDIAWQQTSRLAKLVEELFEVTQLDADEVEIEKERFALAELVQDNALHFAMTARERGITLDSQIDRDLPPICGDIGLIERALRNLIENALRFTPPGGRVEIGAERAGDAVEVFVRDTGCGIAEDELDGVFDRYYRSKGSSTRGGTGLGLAITRRIVRLHGGEIRVESALEKGSTFRIRLPAPEPEERRLEQSA